MDDFELLVDLHRDGARQGPGGDSETRQAIALSGLAEKKGLTIADIGCGSGASTLVLARDLDARILAVDLFAPFLEKLEAEAERQGFSDRISAIAASMEELPFEEGSLDAIWSEGAIYNMGFANGARAWRRFLKPGGILAVSELTWLTARRPAELDEYWNREYPEVGMASAKIAELEQAGYSPVGYFPLPRHCWLDNYYRPLESRFAEFIERNCHSPASEAIVEAERSEIALYERNADFVSYGFYIARRTEA